MCGWVNPSLSNFTCKFLMMIGFDFGLWVEGSRIWLWITGWRFFFGGGGRGALWLWNLVDMIQSFCPITIKLNSYASCLRWEDEHWFLVRGSKVKFNYFSPLVKHCRHHKDHSFCPITFKIHTHVLFMMRGGNPIDFRSQGRRLRSTLAFCKRMPHFWFSFYY